MRSALLQAVDKSIAEQDKWMLCYIGRWVLIILAFILYTILIARGAEAKAARKYEAWQNRWVTEYLAQRDAEAAGMPIDPAEATMQAEAQDLARVLYGIKENNTDDLRTACWCVFNRVDNPEYPASVPEVVAQPKQWMRYDPDNPVLESLYNIAREELEKWRNGSTRPCSADFVYLQWTPAEVVLRNTWTNSSSTRYWRVKE